MILAPGSGDHFPPIDGLEEAEPWGNRMATTAKSVPARLAILGGGVVGVEMADAWRSLGAQVTLIESADRPLDHEERFAGEQVQDGAARARRGGALRLEGHRGPPRRRPARSRSRSRARTTSWPTS